MKSNTNLFSRIIGYLFFLCNLIAIGWLLCCWYASSVSPATTPRIALLTLTTPFAIVVNVLFVIGWLLSARKLRFLWSFITLAVCYKIILQVFAFHFFSANDLTQHPNTFKLMSWNVHGMGIFDKPHNDNARRIMKTIKEEQPDVLSLIEYPVLKDSSKQFSRRIVRDNSFTEYRYNMNDYIGNRSTIGIGIFSRYPVANYKANELSQYIYMLQWDVLLPNNKTIRMFFLHLSSFSLSDADRAFIDTVRITPTVTETQVKQSRSFAQKFDVNYVQRAKETTVAMQIINSSPYPVLICGDFNDLPASYVYNIFRGTRCDAFVEKGAGIGRTYNQLFPTIRIDHIFYDGKALKTLGYKSPANYASDHNPVIANFEVR